MMEPFCIDRFFDILVKEEVPQDDLSNIAGDPRAPGGSGDKPDVALLVDDDVGYHGREWSLPGDGEVVGGGRDAKVVGDARVGKVIHLVVQYYPRGRREYLVAKARKGISQVTRTTRTKLGPDYVQSTRSLTTRAWLV